jgi:hypothetical protein
MGNLLPSSSVLNKPVAFANQRLKTVNAVLGIFNHTILFGSIPTKTLGIDDKYMYDQFGNKITYIAMEAFANFKKSRQIPYDNAYGFSKFDVNSTLRTRSNDFMAQSVACDINNFIGLMGDKSQSNVNDQYAAIFTSCGLSVKSTENDEFIDDTVNNLAYVIISHGSDGGGAWDSKGTLNSIKGLSTYKQKNSYEYYAPLGQNKYVFRDNGVGYNGITLYTGPYSNDFDHKLIWRTTRDLIYKAGMSPYLFCHPSQISLFNFTSNAELVSKSNTRMSYTLKHTLPGDKYKILGKTYICTEWGNYTV